METVGGCGENKGSMVGAKAAGSLKSNDYVALTRDGIRFFAVDAEVFVMPENVWLGGGGGAWRTGGRGKVVVLILGLRDNAAHWAARFRCESHLELFRKCKWSLSPLSLSWSLSRS
jgi:hypothetical protein